MQLPDEEEYNDWIAVHVVDFFNRVNIIYGTVCEFCTETTCPTMSGGPKFEYYWADETQKKPQALPAPQVCSCMYVHVLSVCLSVLTCQVPKSEYLFTSKKRKVIISAAVHCKIDDLDRETD